MNCPKCGAENMSRVINCRDKGSRGTWRRRECTICGYRFSSMEVPVRAKKGKEISLPRKSGKRKKAAENGRGN